jgi:hypothetical protein
VEEKACAGLKYSILSGIYRPLAVMQSLCLSFECEAYGVWLLQMGIYVDDVSLSKGT